DSPVLFARQNRSMSHTQLSIPLDPPKCRCIGNIHRSRRRGFLDCLHHLIGRYPFRCWDCGRRFYRFCRR
ncbi:MAG TPA: hypothetical protein VH681_10920, partial [Nitrospiraceae bacterium]